ncbi:hypothetical protein [uncultured Oscillibacter sp.]|uniref:hypothetical protein n=1 Tax=uncultured Oscillibacter sp. TaxID=876091 RepID=UPI00261ED0B3|nr:hypothetical protein [uncultured Oscillibacter sp.]
MFDILTALYHDDPLSPGIFCNLESPQSPDERRIATQLRVVDEKIAEALIPSIEALADRQAEEAFYKGVRIGAQLMVQLMEDF